MLYWSFIFFVISVITGLMGLNGIAGLTMDIAKFLIGLFLVLAVIFLALGIWGYRKAKNALST